MMYHMIAKDKSGKPITCDCPDGAEHPCDGTGWCTKLKESQGPFRDFLKGVSK